METNDKLDEQSPGGIKKIFAGKRLAVVLAAVLLLLAILAYAAYTQSKILSHEDIQTIVKNEDCDKGLKQIGNRKTDLKNTKDSIALLSYKGNCELVVGKYQQAEISFQDLKGLYQKTHNREGVKSAQSAITYAKDRAAHPVKPAEKQPLNDPKLEQYLKEKGMETN